MITDVRTILKVIEGDTLVDSKMPCGLDCVRHRGRMDSLGIFVVSGMMVLNYVGLLHRLAEIVAANSRRASGD